VSFVRISFQKRKNDTSDEIRMKQGLYGLPCCDRMGDFAHECDARPRPADLRGARRPSVPALAQQGYTARFVLCAVHGAPGERGEGEIRTIFIDTLDKGSGFRV